MSKVDLRIPTCVPGSIQYIDGVLHCKMTSPLDNVMNKLIDIEDELKSTDDFTNIHEKKLKNIKKSINKLKKSLELTDKTFDETYDDVEHLKVEFKDFTIRDELFDQNIVTNFTELEDRLDELENRSCEIDNICDKIDTIELKLSNITHKDIFYKFNELEITNKFLLSMLVELSSKVASLESKQQSNLSITGDITVLK
jgi:chromosome segregation ATPase